MDCLITGEIRKTTEKILQQISTEGVFGSKVLSTWKGSLLGIDVPNDWIIVESDDPGPLGDGEEKAKNILRSATLSYKGIDHITDKYVFRGRTDMQITPFGYARLKKYSANKHLRHKLLFDTVGTTTEFLHFSDFCLATETKVLKNAYANLHQRVTDKNARAHLYNLIENSPYQLFHKKRYGSICPAETMNFIFAFYPSDFDKCKSISEIETSLLNITSQIYFFRLRDFQRGTRLDPRAGVKPFYRYLRGKVSVGGALGKFIDNLY